MGVIVMEQSFLAATADVRIAVTVSCARGGTGTSMGLELGPGPGAGSHKDPEEYIMSCRRSSKTGSLASKNAIGNSNIRTP